MVVRTRCRRSTGNRRQARRHSGTGLGMPLTKTFVEMHGGTVELESVVGRGTRVTLRLPHERRLALAS